MDAGAWAVVGIGVAQVGTLAAIILQGHEQRKTAKQLKPNGGSSLRDSTDRIERLATEARDASTSALNASREAIEGVRSVDKRVDNISGDIGHIKERLNSHIDGREPRSQRKRT